VVPGDLGEAGAAELVVPVVEALGEGGEEFFFGVFLRGPRFLRFSLFLSLSFSLSLLSFSLFFLFLPSN